MNEADDATAALKAAHDAAMEQLTPAERERAKLLARQMTRTIRAGMDREIVGE